MKGKQHHRWRDDSNWHGSEVRKSDSSLCCFTSTPVGGIYIRCLAHGVSFLRVNDPAWRLETTAKAFKSSAASSASLPESMVFGLGSRLCIGAHWKLRVYQPIDRYNIYSIRAGGNLWWRGAFGSATYRWEWRMAKWWYQWHTLYLRITLHHHSSSHSHIFLFHKAAITISCLPIKIHYQRCGGGKSNIRCFVCEMKVNDVRSFGRNVEPIYQLCHCKISFEGADEHYSIVGNIIYNVGNGI